MRIAALIAAVFVAALVPASGTAQTSGESQERASSGPAIESLNQGRRAKGQGRIAQAERHFQKALAVAEREGDVYQSALEELTYHLPLMRVERYALAGEWKQAEQILQDLLESHQDDEEKSRHLVQLIAKLRSEDRGLDGGGVYAQPGSGRKAIGQIQQVLERFLAEYGRYPDGYAELNEVLPAGRYPLDEYDIVHYVGRGDAYGLTLRSKNDPLNLLSVQKTGLVE